MDSPRDFEEIARATNTGIVETGISLPVCREWPCGTEETGHLHTQKLPPVMQLGTKEHQDMMQDFEKFVKTSSFSHMFRARLEKEAKELWSKGRIYCDGGTNNMFHLYCAGYANARCIYMN